MKEYNVIVTVEDAPPDKKVFAEYLITLMEWQKREEQRKKAV